MIQSDNKYDETSRRMADLPNPSQYQRDRTEERRYSGVVRSIYKLRISL